MSMLNTLDLSVGYDKKAVVKNVKINALKGQMVCLLGPNGSGKTTILRTLSGLLEPVKGNVFIKFHKVDSKNNKKLSKILSVVLTERPNSGLMSVFDLVAMGRYPHTGFLGKLSEKDNEIIIEALKLVNADKLASRYFTELSDGEKQKVLLARALAQEPEVMILDEPTIHLDIKHKLEVITILKKLCNEKNITVVLSLHEIDLALKCCDYMLLVKDGNVIEAGIPEEVVREDSIKRLYDIKSAKYDQLLGTIEFCESKETGIFVLGGNGSGAPIFKSLNKKGYSFTTGILHKNDVDYHIAKSFEAKIIEEQAFCPIKEETFKNAVKKLDGINILIDAGFEIGEHNDKNISLIKEAISKNIKVFSLRNNKLDNIDNNKIEYIESMSNLFSLLKIDYKNIT
jgi:iron complex transport system ATP-binding protein